MPHGATIVEREYERAPLPLGDVPLKSYRCPHCRRRLFDGSISQAGGAVTVKCTTCKHTTTFHGMARKPGGEYSPFRCHTPGCKSLLCEILPHPGLIVLIWCRKCKAVERIV